MPASQAFTATILYRLISYVLVVVVGWIVIFAGYRSYRDTLDVDPDAVDKNGEQTPDQPAEQDAAAEPDAVAAQDDAPPSLDDEPPNPGPLDEGGPSTGASGSGQRI